MYLKTESASIQKLVVLLCKINSVITAIILIGLTMYICIAILLLQVNNDAGGGAGDAAEGGGAGENVNNAQEAPEEEDNNGANQDAENGAHNGDGTYYNVTVV